jgi:hypothetical protein
MRSDYREFRPHPCGTLIADLVDELATVATIALELDWESLYHTIDEHFQVQGVWVTKQSGVGSAEVGSPLAGPHDFENWSPQKRIGRRKESSSW